MKGLESGMTRGYVGETKQHPEKGAVKGNNHVKFGTSELTWRVAGPRTQGSKVLGVNGASDKKTA